MSTGPRGRGRARGRSRGAGPPEARRPGEPQPRAASSEQQIVGRGRGRAAAVAPPKQQPPPPQQQPQPPPPQQQPQPPTEQMAAVSLNGAAAPPQPRPQPQGGPTRERRGPMAEPHTRPEHITDKSGATGHQITVVSNFIRLRNRPNTAIFQYNVSYSPQVDNKGLRLKLVYQQEELIGKVRAFDGMILYLPFRLPQDETKIVTTLPRDDTPVTVTITLTNELSAKSPICLQLFNVIFRRILHKLDMRQIGRHYYSNKNPIKIPQHKLEMWPGYITSILQYEKEVMLCADVSHKILRIDTVYDAMNDLYSRVGQRTFHDQAMKMLVGEIVLTRYNNKTYRIDDIDWEKNPTYTFETSRGQISFLEYYKKMYDVQIYDHEQPLLVSQPKKREIRARGGDMGPVLLIPSLCTRTGLSQEAREDFRVMKDVAEYTRISPQQRAQTLAGFNKDIHTQPDIKEELEGWNLQFDPNLLKFQARVLPPEKIYQRSASFSYKAESADWSREMRGQPLISSVGLFNYMVLCTSRDQDKAEDFAQTLRRVGPPMGIEVKDPAIYVLSDDRTDTYLRTIKQKMTEHTQMVICILPTNRKDRYDAIKKMCCMTNPVPSQCLLGRTLMKKQQLMSVTTKVALQLNCKLGGELWALEIPEYSGTPSSVDTNDTSIILKKMMVVGFDTYHDSSRRGGSVGGFIASTNATLTKYFTQCVLQTTGQELLDSLKLCMTNALRKYHEVNGALPERVMVYRDGVGDGQLPAVVEHEVPQFLDSFKSQGDGAYNPKFAVIVVKKRINSRVFLEGRQLTNPPPGTIVDSDITKPEWYDFFLVSQSVRQGTVTPTHFNVIYDTSGMRPDHMQRLTYKLCHLYYNWPGTVRVPAPCQYAHKLAFLVGQSIHDLPSPVLADRLYFL